MAACWCCWFGLDADWGEAGPVVEDYRSRATGSKETVEGTEDFDFGPVPVCRHRACTTRRCACLPRSPQSSSDPFTTAIAVEDGFEYSIWVSCVPLSSIPSSFRTHHPARRLGGLQREDLRPPPTPTSNSLAIERVHRIHFDRLGCTREGPVRVQGPADGQAERALAQVGQGRRTEVRRWDAGAARLERRGSSLPPWIQHGS